MSISWFLCYRDDWISILLMCSYPSSFQKAQKGDGRVRRWKEMSSWQFKVSVPLSLSPSSTVLGASSGATPGAQICAPVLETSISFLLFPWYKFGASLPFSTRQHLVNSCVHETILRVEFSLSKAKLRRTCSHPGTALGRSGV